MTGYESRHTAQRGSASLILLIALGTLGLTLLAYALLRPNPGRTCRCGRPKVDKGSHFACTVCDFDPDPRPEKQAEPQWWHSDYWEKHHRWPKDEPKDPRP